MPTPSERGHPSLHQFLDLRDSVRAARIGNGGRQVCEALTSSLDRAIEDLITPLPDHVAIVAVGGYGRAELSPFSDVDLMLLHAVEDPSEIAAALFRPLWDSKLRVGHAVRTVKEAAMAARERFDTQTTLLTGRLVAGDSEMFDALMSEVAAVTRARPLRRYLVAEERERRRLSPYLLMATDVKTGRGGLRTLQGFEWEQRRGRLIGRFSAESGEEERTATESLLQVRNALHVSAGRRHDVFSPGLRGPAARWLGHDELEVATRLVVALQTVDHYATRRWPEVVDAPQRRVWRRFGPRTAKPSDNGEPTADEIVGMVEGGERGRLEFDILWEEGRLGKVLPEWESVRRLPELAPFHEHPVASHLWRAVDEMKTLIAEEGHYGRVATELDMDRVLILSAFLHDIGKGRGGDHASRGAIIARDFCERLGLSETSSSLIEDAVRHHLLLPITATRRDIDDPAVIGETAETLGNLQLLQVVYLLTVADSRATGASMWNDWKATLLRTLFARCAARFGGDRAVEGATTAEVLALATSEKKTEVSAHLTQMPEDYLRSAGAADVIWHLELIEGLVGPSNLGVRAGDPVDQVVIVGQAMSSFRRRVAEVFAANGIDVLEARLMTRSDGVVVDTFRVRDDRTGGSVDSGKWGRVGHDLEAGLLGRLDTGDKVAERAAAYRETGGDKPEVRGAIDRASGDLVFTIKCADRIGRLAEILAVLGDCGLDIRLAQIDSRAGEVVDTFHVVGGDPGLDIGSLEQRLSSAIVP